ncbi:hypothetical protein CFN78_24825 [Amycolatopsis antarctica]|uniref:Photosystem reaction center subunit H n=1 Tax=Amycolatopsis antarctica TaxID=1854586 RepID=A0A263CZU3_9PSEU|nr:PRC and DUF2382 domain-containing protein [Amycolatopsis antarctica]OZM70625.1 hypothetical protein CFN78_24825 [Amycolatopsis antarctica]
MDRTIRPQDLIDSTVMDPEGSKIGKVGTVYVDDDTHQPEWVTVKTGLFGHKESFVPLSGADVDNDGVHVKVAKDQVSDAPQFDAEGHLSKEESAELYRYYGLPSPRSGQREDDAHSGNRQKHSQDQAGMRQGMAAGTAGAAAGTAGAAGGRMGTPAEMPAAKDRSAKPGGSQHAKAETGSEGMIRSEEQMKVGTEEVETGHVRLRKYVVTEEQQVTVPVSHEEVRLEREPITEGTRGVRSEIGEDSQDVILHAEKPVVQKESVPVERVRLGTEKVTEEQTVSGQVRKEQIEIDDDTKRGGKQK